MSAALESAERDIAAEKISPLLKVSLPFPHRLNCLIRVWIFKISVAVALALHRLFYPAPAASRPTLEKRYACRPTLRHRLFFPPNYQSGTALPLYINIHGGGFAACDAQFDDEFCISWAKRTGMLVASLSYRKAPLHAFPTPVHDIAAVANALLTDATLPIDTTKITIGGFSAGGNLALCASQLPGLKGTVQAALSFYPIVDWSVPIEEKLARRPYAPAPPDSLARSAACFDWAYVRVGQDRRDPRLSPCYAARADLPPRIYMVGAQYDMLRLEAQDMIHELAGAKDVMDPEADFELGPYRWTMARNVPHGFTHQLGQKPAKRAKRERVAEEIYAAAYEWLKRGGLA